MSESLQNIIVYAIIGVVVLLMSWSVIKKATSRFKNSCPGCGEDCKK